jgi:hypothetical protein
VDANQPFFSGPAPPGFAGICCIMLSIMRLQFSIIRLICPIIPMSPCIMPAAGTMVSGPREASTKRFPRQSPALAASRRESAASQARTRFLKQAATDVGGAREHWIAWLRTIFELREERDRAGFRTVLLVFRELLRELGEGFVEDGNLVLEPEPDLCILVEGLVARLARADRGLEA